MSYSKPHIVFIPGDVYIDAVDALERALSKVPRRLSLVTRYPKAKQAVATTLPSAKSSTGRSQAYINESRADKKKRIRRELLECGATWYGLLKSETRVLSKLLQPDEHVEAVVYGQHHSNSVMLVATSTRIIYLDKKPMALFLDEVSYEVVSGLEFEIHTMFASLTLHTPVKNYDIKFANLRCAENFARHIETERLKKVKLEDNKPSKTEVILPSRKWIDSEGRFPSEPKEGMAGYYLLPMEEEEVAGVRVQVD